MTLGTNNPGITKSANFSRKSIKSMCSKNVSLQESFEVSAVGSNLYTEIEPNFGRRDSPEGPGKEGCEAGGLRLGRESEQISIIISERYDVDESMQNFGKEMGSIGLADYKIVAGDGERTGSRGKNGDLLGKMNGSDLPNPKNTSTDDIGLSISEIEVAKSVAQTEPDVNETIKNFLIGSMLSGQDANGAIDRPQHMVTSPSPRESPKNGNSRRIIGDSNTLSPPNGNLKASSKNDSRRSVGKITDEKAGNLIVRPFEAKL